MKRRIFYIEHLIQMLLLTRSFYAEIIPLSIFIVTIAIMFRVKYDIEGFTILSLLLVIFFLVEVAGEVLTVIFLQYLGSILSGLLYFAPLRFYWLPEHSQTVGFRQDRIGNNLHYFEFFPLDQDK